MPIDYKLINGQKLKMFNVNNSASTSIFLDGTILKVGDNSIPISFLSNSSLFAGDISVGGQVKLNTTNSKGIVFADKSRIASANGDEIAFVGNKEFRFSDSSSWDYNLWGGIKYDSANKTTYIGGAGGVFKANGGTGTDITLDLSNKVTKLKLPDRIEFTSSGDRSAIQNTIVGTSTYMDFELGDDANADKYRWRFFPSSGGDFSLMELSAATSSSAKLNLNGNLELKDLVLEPRTNGSLRVGNTNGYIDIGAQNGSWCHINSSLPFYMGSTLDVVDRIRVYSSNTYLSSTDGKINNYAILTSKDIGSYTNANDRLTSKLANVKELYDVFDIANKSLPSAGGIVNGDLIVNCANTIGTDNNGNKLYVTRSGSTSTEFASHNISDGSYFIHYKNDEVSSRVIFSLENADTENSDGSNASTKNFMLFANKNEAYMTVDGQRVLTYADKGHTKGIDADTVDGYHANRIITLQSDKTYDWVLSDSVTQYEFLGGVHASGNKYMTFGSSGGSLDIFFDGFLYKEISTNVFKKFIYEGMNCTLGTVTASLNGNSSTSSKWQTARTLSLSGDVTGSTTIDGSGNVDIATVVADNSHNHTNLTGVTSISFNANSTDSTSIRTVVESSATYLDFYLADDPNNDMFRWRFKPSSTDSTLGIEKSLMELYPTSAANDAAKLKVYGNIEAQTGFIGNLIGNASTSSKWNVSRTITLGGDLSGSVAIDGTSNVTLNAEVSDDSHTHSFIKTQDTRSDNPKPADMTDYRYKPEFKTRTAIDNAPGSGLYNGVVSFAPWSNSSGGNAYQMSYGYKNTNVPVLSVRSGVLAGTEWGSWYELYHTGNKPTANDVGARPSNWLPSWGDVTDKPSSFNPSEHNHDSLYLKLSGGTLTGPVNLGANELRAGGADGFSLVISANAGMVYLRPNKNDSTKEFTISTTQMSFNGNKVYHAGDKPTAADIGALPAVGGTINGDISVKGNIEISQTSKNFIAPNNYGYMGKLTDNSNAYMLWMDTSNQIIVGQGGRQILFDCENIKIRSGLKIWHEGNDGHNSTLDADTLDGIHASGFSRMNYDNSGYFRANNYIENVVNGITLGLKDVGGYPTIRTGGDADKTLKVMGSADKLRAQITPTGSVEAEENIKAKKDIVFGNEKATMKFNEANETIDFIFN